MSSFTRTDVMPAPLRGAVLDTVVDAMDFLLDVMRYSSPVLAHHGWAERCMYGASQVMDTIGYPVRLIAVHLEREGCRMEAIRRLLRTEQECVRTATPPVRSRGPAPELMPDRLMEKTHSVAALVTLRLAVALRRSQAARDAHWARHCLFPLVEAMDALGRLTGAIAAHAGPLDERALYVHQRLGDQKPRSGMPYERDRDFVARMLARRTGEFGGFPEPDTYDAAVVVGLEWLDRSLGSRRRDDKDGTPLPQAQRAAVALLHALSACPHVDGGHRIYWLPEPERSQAVALARLLMARAA